MTEFAASAIMLAAPHRVAVRLKDILENAGYEVNTVVFSGQAALQAAQERGRPGLLVTTYRLSDMTGLSLARRLGELGGALVIAPPGIELADAPDYVVTLVNPMNRDAFLQSAAVLLRMNERILRLGREINRLTRTLDERKAIERAKGVLMDTMHLTEAEAHHRMQKISMDSGMRLADVARGIVDAGGAWPSDQGTRAWDRIEA